MKRWCAVVTTVVIASLVGPVAQAKTGLDASWSNGIRINSQDGSFKLKLGGRLQNDWAWFSQDDENEAAYGNLQDGTEYRRLRLYASGLVYGNIDFKVQFDFAGAGSGDDVALKDAYVGVKGIPVLGTVRVGNQYEPMGLEELTSSKYITFMERSPVSAFIPSRNSGILATNTIVDKRGTVTVGVFRDTDDGGVDQGDGNYAATGRVTYLPMFNKDDQRFIHVGAAATQRNPGSSVQYRLRPASHLAERMVSTGSIATDAVMVAAGELAIVSGPVTVRAEVAAVNLDAPMVDDPQFTAGYAAASYFITGESRPYKASAGTFDRVSPAKDFSESGGSGAWEVAFRYGMADLNSGPINGGELMDLTFALNWYLNPNTRIMFNYVRAEATEVGDPAADTGAMNAFQTRFAIDF